jgi:hypothetical protein
MAEYVPVKQKNPVSTMSDITAAEDRCRGVLVGLAAGDKIGGPIRMAVRLAESLIACNGFNPSDILERYLTWWQEGAFDTGPVPRMTALFRSSTGGPLVFTSSRAR